MSDEQNRELADLPPSEDEPLGLSPSEERQLLEVLDRDALLIQQKDVSYGSSWKRRGGVGAYMVSVRKLDRIEHQVSQCGGMSRALSAIRAQEVDSMREDIRDLRCYMLLILSELLPAPPNGRALDLRTRLALVVHAELMPSVRPWGGLWLNERRAPKDYDPFGRHVLSRWATIDREAAAVGYDAFRMLRELGRVKREWLTALGLLALLELRLQWADSAAKVCEEPQGRGYVQQD